MEEAGPHNLLDRGERVVQEVAEGRRVITLEVGPGVLPPATSNAWTLTLPPSPLPPALSLQGSGHSHGPT